MIISLDPVLIDFRCNLQHKEMLNIFHQRLWEMNWDKKGVELILWTFDCKNQIYISSIIQIYILNNVYGIINYMYMYWYSNVNIQNEAH